MSSQSNKNNYREANVEIIVSNNNLDISHLIIPFHSLNAKDWIHEGFHVKPDLTDNDRKMMKTILRKELRSLL